MNANLKDKNPTEMSEKNIIARTECPMCKHWYGNVYADENDNNDQRSVACCGCPCDPVTVPVGEKAPTTSGGPVSPPGPGQLLRTKGHHPGICQDEDCNDADCRKSSPATGVTKGNSSVSAQTLPEDEDGVKEPKPIDDDSVPEGLGQKLAPGGGNSSASSNQDVATPKGFVAYYVDGRRGFVNIGHLVRHPECASIYGLKEEYYRKLKDEEEEEAELEGEDGRLYTPSFWNF